MDIVHVIINVHGWFLNKLLVKILCMYTHNRVPPSDLLLVNTILSTDIFYIETHTSFVVLIST